MNAKTRRPSWGDKKSALSFYSGKVPANAGLTKPKPKVSQPVLQATPQTESSRIPIPDYTKKKISKHPTPSTSIPQKKVHKGKPKRPSLTEQLASIGAQAGALTSEIKKKHGMEEDMRENDEPPVLVSPSKSFKVGSLECKYPSPVQFYKDRCVYTYHHPFQPKEILMVMRYADMSQPQLTKPASRIGSVRFRFKVMRDFEQFKGVYGPGDWIEISFNTTSDYDNVKELVLPFCMGKKRK
ncbi:hypothetical protein TrLO_g10405 [Triparma laevis f. longispina]|uniref:Uncharacterized protein n=1 Tax=Triparma laevis f. longispina TaxID=1714387 RepID=A0A9W7FMZ7_9STRA|nr:hypothetical protein TrLO_g10405 [Triparma laevis f. longispina]